MREVELKSVVDDLAARRNAVEKAGGKLVYEGNLSDTRYVDTAESMLERDHVLRVRVYESVLERRGSLDWKGRTSYEDGFKVREELSTNVADPDALASILESLGFKVTMEIERRIWQYELDGATVRFEEYPRMDTLVEVEGSPESIENAIRALGLPREGFTSDRLSAFVQRFEARTGERRALSSRELTGDYLFSSAST